MTDAPVATYHRDLGASLERLFENALDWEHLPHSHGEDFKSVALVEEGPSGWSVDALLGDDRMSRIELRLDRAAGRWVTTSTVDGRLKSRIVSDSRATGPDSCHVDVGFYIHGLPPSQLDVAGRYYQQLYARLYDEDERLMKARAEAVRLGAAAHEARRPARLRDGRVVQVPVVCPHQALPLAAEPDAEGVITCPWHGYRFDAVTGRNLDGKSCGWAGSSPERGGDPPKVGEGRVELT